MSTLRLGRIGYINCYPVYGAIDRGAVPVPAELVTGTPSELNDLLAAGELDLSVVSTVEYARNARDYVLLPDLAISCDGPVRSVAVFSRRPVEQLDGRTVLLTASSRTAVALVALLLAARRAYPYRCDLGEAWKRWTGLPFVFAVWAGRRDAEQRAARKVHEALLASRAWGLAHLDVLAEAAGRTCGVPSATCLAYLAGLDYALGYKHLAGLTDFFRRLAARGLVPDGSLQFLHVA